MSGYEALASMVPNLVRTALNQARRVTLTLTLILNLTLTLALTLTLTLTPTLNQERRDVDSISAILTQGS